MGRMASTNPDPTLARLHEVAERIRERAAAGRQRPAPAPAPVPVPQGPPPPHHWADGPDGGTDETTH